MQPTSQSQFDAVEASTVPELERVRHSVWALPLPMPNEIPFSLCYLFIGDSGDIGMIDPGWDSNDNWQRMTEALDRLGSSIDRVTSITVTHLHPDHLGMAARVRAASGAPVALHRIEQDALDEMTGNSTPAGDMQFDQWQVPDDRRAEIADARRARHDYPPFTADRLLDDGEVVVLGDHRLIVLRTPGHTSGHICLKDEADGLIFTGDHVLPTIFSGLGLGGLTESSPMADYLDALDRLNEFDEYEVCPGHGFRFRGLAERCDELAEHHLRRAREIALIIAESPAAPIYAIASKVTWTAGFANLRGLSLQSALVQTAMHRQFVSSASGRARLAEA